MYSKSLVSTTTSSPASINGGTWILNPLSNSAGFYDDDTVWPFNATSVDLILQFTWLGKSTEIGLSL